MRSRGVAAITLYREGYYTGKLGIVMRGTNKHTCDLFVAIICMRGGD